MPKYTKDKDWVINCRMHLADQNHKPDGPMGNHKSAKTSTTVGPLYNDFKKQVVDQDR